MPTHLGSIYRLQVLLDRRAVCDLKRSWFSCLVHPLQRLNIVPLKIFILYNSEFDWSLRLRTGISKAEHSNPAVVDHLVVSKEPLSQSSDRKPDILSFENNSRLYALN
jgi:hypothetical protein